MSRMARLTLGWLDGAAPADAAAAAARCSAGFVDLQDTQRLLHGGRRDVARQDRRPHVNRSATARAGDAAAVLDVEPVGHQQIGVGLRELLQEVPVVKPADADPVPVQHAGAHQREGAGAHPTSVVREPPAARMKSSVALLISGVARNSPPTTTR